MHSEIIKYGDDVEASKILLAGDLGYNFLD